MTKHTTVPNDINALKGDDARFSEWHKSERSGTNGNCVEVGTGHKEYTGFIGVRDTKNPNGPALAFTPSEWTAFLQGAKDGEFDLR